ncbi:DUF2877 domain-containing protein [Paenibacillus sp. BSR1-1]|uniref:DUF2877 domain-containing protein n=1 Tax=Paenibacillus sp. BSR1-1 TaxID=3020845 RepID=UPI0025AF56AC|nr:DUF2877 domain-containing protein [Paenibacillus sp. BSR1-1]MDN3017031.1 DUF2877 domain-containing protein [Paenibacillus sp. BSR1-1]
MRNILSGDVDFIKRLNGSNFSGFVHSAFKRTFNIQCFDSGEVYTIACRYIDNAPNTLIVDTENTSQWNIEVNDRVFVEDRILYISNKLALNISRVNIWESILPPYPNNEEILLHNVRRAREYIDCRGKGGGIKKHLIPLNPFEAETCNMLEQRTKSLLYDLAMNRMDHAIKHAVSLIGLGPGLTPSGDDFLTGLFTTLQMEHSPLYEHRSFCEKVTMKAKPLTNDISYSALKQASIGKVRESIISLVNSLLIENEDDLILSLNKVLDIGSSSGTDIALGLVCGLEANIKAGGKLC